MSCLQDLDQRVEKRDVVRIAHCIEGWYRTHGAVMDPVSRYWVIALREEAFSWLCQNRGARDDEVLGWNDPAAVRLWFTKTALRISLSRHLTNPEFLQPPRPEDGWLRMQHEIRPQLLRNYRLVRRAWMPLCSEGSEALHLAEPWEIEDVIDEVLVRRSLPRRIEERALRWRHRWRRWRSRAVEAGPPPPHPGPLGEGTSAGSRLS